VSIAMWLLRPLTLTPERSSPTAQQLPCWTPSWRPTAAADRPLEEASAPKWLPKLDTERKEAPAMLTAGASDLLYPWWS
jgi:hypothetical protein